MKPAKISFLLVLLFIMILAASCSNEKNETASTSTFKAYEGESIELVIHSTGLSDVLFEEVVQPVVRAKYPNIELKLVKDNLEEMLASNIKLDIVGTAGIAVGDMVRLDIPEDVSPLLKKFNVDLSRIEPAIVSELKEISALMDKDGSMLVMPFWMNQGTLIYNKDIFDRFGEAYPKESMTWDEMLDLSKKLTRVEGDTQYIGGAVNSYVNIFRQYGAGYSDPETNEVYLTSDKHVHVASLIKGFLDIPGYIQDTNYRHTNFSSGTVAMYTNWMGVIANQFSANPVNFEWDLTTYPVFPENPNYGAPADYLVFLVSKASPNKEAAFRVLIELLTDETQRAVAMKGWGSVLNDTDIKKAFGTESGVFQGKNLDAVFKVVAAPNPPYFEHRTEVNNAINELVRKMALEKVDINTALREAEEEAKQNILDK